MAADVRMTPATPDDVVLLAATLRLRDADEVRAALGEEPLPVLLAALPACLEAWSVWIEGELACMWGVSELPVEVGGEPGRVCGWLLTTRVVERRRRAFWRLCKDLLPLVCERWGELVNAIDVRHEQAIRWAQWLGFRLAPAEPYGVAGLPFRRCAVRKEDLCALPGR